MRRPIPRHLPAITLLWLTLHGAAEAYSLVHPTPKDQMRELSTDRPDRTESAYTVPAGRYQLEMDIISVDLYLPDRGATGSLRAFNLNMKAGLTERVDLQIMFPVVERAWSPRSVECCFGQTLTLRSKINLLGNDSGPVAIALMPYVAPPLTHARQWSVGWILPVAFGLPRDWALGLMLEHDIVGQRRTTPVHTLIATATAAHSIVGDLGGYLELFSACDILQPPTWEIGVDGGLTLGLGDNLQLDAGVNYGIVSRSLNPFLGLAARF